MQVYTRNFLLFIFAFIFFSAKAQDCNCGNNFKFVIEKVKKNYVGYNDKVTSFNKKKFEKITDSLLNEAREAPNYQCFPILRKWLSFFNDKHISLSYDDSNYNKEQIKSYYANEEKTDWTDSLLSSYLDNKKSGLDSLEGIWKDYTGAYQVGIVRDIKSKNDFIGFIMKADGARWMPQQIKFRITKKSDNYFLKQFKAIDHSINPLSFKKIKDTLTFGDGTVTSIWYKASVVIPQPNKKKLTDDSFPKFKILDEKNCLFQMPPYASLDYLNTMDSLIKKNSDELKKHDHLIIDLRNNYGGSVLIYDKLIPYIYSTPILTEGGRVLATEENIRDYYSHIPSNVSDSMKRIFEKNLNTLKLNINELYPLYPVDTISISNVLNYPKYVSLIINKNTASAAELFILQARQSSKVKLYGTNSSGAIDYLEVVKTKLPYGFYTLGYPACKSMRLPDYPLDNVGIEPDIEIPAEVSNWIEFVKAERGKNR